MKNSKFLSIVLSVVLSVLGVVLLTQAATVISTNITTSGTLGVTGLTTLVNATTTGNASIAGALWINGNATTTSAGAISTQSTLGVLGVTTLTGNTILTTASSTDLVKVHSLQVGASGSAFAMALADYCTIADITITASTTAYMDCTPSADTIALIAANKAVLVMATSSLHKNFIVTQASTSLSMISLAIYNSGQDSTTDTVGPNSLNFFIMSK